MACATSPARLTSINCGHERGVILQLPADYKPAASQRDHAQDHGQPERGNLFKGLIDNIGT